MAESVAEVEEIQNKDFRGSKDISLDGSTASRIRKKRTVVTVQLLEQMKPYFLRYREDKENMDIPSAQKLKMRHISLKFNLSGSEAHTLYDEFCQDPLFVARRAKAEAVAMSREGGKRPPNSINTQRLDYINELIKEETYLTI